MYQSNLNAEEQSLEIIKNLDLRLRMTNSKVIFVVSDKKDEGTIHFISECVTKLSDIYARKVFVLDFSNISNFEKQSLNLTYANISELDFLDEKNESENEKRINSYIQELLKNYDNIFVNTQTLNNSENTKLPSLKVDSAIIVRSQKSLNSKKLPITDEILDRKIPILGFVLNEDI
jgi:hypothetical protein